MSFVTQYILITKGANDYTTQSYNVWAKTGSCPQSPGDGVYVGNIPIGTNASSVTVAWVPPNNGIYQFLSQPVRYDVTGIPARIGI